MSIDDIKDVKKLRMILKEVLQENKQLKEILREYQVVSSKSLSYLVK